MNAYARMTLAALGTAFMLPWPASAQPEVERSVGFGFAQDQSTAIQVPDAANTARGFRQEVFAESLGQTPLAVPIGVFAHGEGYAAPLRAGDLCWWDFLTLTCSLHPDLELRLSYVKDSEGIETAECVRQGKYGLKRDVPERLVPGDRLNAAFRITLADGGPLPPGEYELKLGVRPDAEGFFGARCVPISWHYRLVIKPREPGDDDAYFQEEIERYIRWGRLLDNHGFPEGKRVMERGLEMVQKYIDSGQADADGYSNVSARRQAAVLCERLDKPRKAVGYLQMVISRGSNNKCKACRFHFPVTEDGEYRGVATPRSRFIEDIYTWRNNLYMKVYGHPVWTPAPTSAPAKASRKP